MVDYQGNTISLTNPGGIGTEHSVPRLMKGAGCIIGAGALEYPAEFQGTSAEDSPNLGIGKTITLTSTYDHRVIQGAGSGEFLKLIHERLIGKHNFYEEIFADLRIPYEPIHWAFGRARRQGEPRSTRRLACRSSSTPSASAATSWPTSTRSSTCSARTPTSTSRPTG
jgi:hypothetical protein